jgi:RHS repeat-associated protein
MQGERPVLRLVRLTLIALATVSLTTASVLNAQVDLTQIIGLPERAHLLPVRFGYVNLDNGNLHLEIPLYSMPYRGHPAVTSTLIYDSMFWNYWPLTGGPQEMLYPTEAGWSVGGGDLDQVGGATGSPVSMLNCSAVEGDLTGYIYLYSSYSTTDTHQTTRHFSFLPTSTPELADAQCSYVGSGLNYPGNNNSTILGYQQNGTVYADDGSGFRLTVTKANNVQSRYITAPSGTGVNAINSADILGSTANGNTYDLSTGLVDQLGTAYPTLAGTTYIGSFYSTLSTYLSYQPYAAKSPVTGTMTRAGTSVQYQYTWTYIPVCTGNSSTDYCGGMWVLGAISLPGGGSYTFGYDQGTSPGHLGKLTSITLPTGGTVSYGYGPLTCGSGSTANFCGGQVQSISDGGTLGNTTTITYSNATRQAGTGSYGPWVYYPVTVLYPVHVTSVAVRLPGFVQDQTVFSASTNAFVKTEYSGTTTVLRTTTTTVDNYGRPTAVKSVWAASGESHEIDYKYADDASLSGTMVYGQPGINMVGLATEYNSGALVRSVRTTYLQDTSSNKYVSSFNMINYPSSASLMDSNGTVVSQVQYTYDEYSASYCSQHYPKGLSGLSMLTSVAGAAGHDDTNYGVGYTARGNPTTITYTGQNVVNPIVVHKCYDTLGNVTQSIDGNGNATRFTYTDNFTDSTCLTAGKPTYAFPTTVTDALGHNTSTSYYSCNRAAYAVKDPNDIANSRSGTVYSYDSAFRPTCANHPDGGQICTSYPTTTEIDVTTHLNSSGATDTVQTLFDPFGRAITKIDVGSGIETLTNYDVFNRTSSVSNPQFVSGSSPSDGATSFAYDAFGRKSSQKNPDATTETWSYSGNSETYTDQSSNQWIRTSDSLGRLVKVLEPNGSSSNPTMETDYSYDVLNDLKSVTQWGGPSGSSGPRTRSFTYDGLSHLLTSANPESGTTTYTYDGDGNVLTKKDARGVTISYTYEPLNRVNWKHYSDGTTIAAGFGYDGNDATGNPISPAVTNAIGRLSQLSEVTASAITNISYDPMGRITQKKMCIPGDCNYDVKVNATWDYAGNVLSLSNGSSAHPITWTYAYDLASRPQTITSSVSADSITTLFQATSSSPVSYGPVGLQYAWLGINSTSGLPTSIVNRAYDLFTRLVTENDTNSSGATQYSFTGSSFTPNGSPAQINDSVVGNISYTYDTLSRLITGGASSGQYAGQYGCWSYDPWGNRTAEVFPSPSACPPSGPSATASYDTNNHVTWTSVNAASSGFTYDAAGNVLYDGLNNYLYDGEGRVCAVKQVVNGTVIYQGQYIYDSAGNRVGKGTLASFSCNRSTNGFAVTNGYVVGLGGEQLTEINGSNQWQHSNLFNGGQLLATYTGSDVYITLNDRLGTKRAEIKGGAGCITTYSSIPYGDLLSSSGNCPSDVTEHHFTGKERDSESGNDYFGVRYYASTMGRFVSPDHPLIDQHPENPQSWNLYAYARNNPLINIDPTGLGCVTDLGQGSDSNHEGVELNNSISFDDCAGQHGTWVPGDVNKDNIGAYRGDDGNINFQVTTNTGVT